jgi:hypothetical protein
MTDHEIEMLRAALTRVETACRESVTISTKDLRELLDEIDQNEALMDLLRLARERPFDED